MIWSFFVQQYVAESALCESYLENLVVFNDPDDDEYEDDDETENGSYYLGEELNENYWMYKILAKGNADTFLRLYYETSRVDVIKILAYSATFAKERSKLERKKNGRRY